MRKNYFAKLVKYMKNVYHIERGLNKLFDGSFNELNLMIKNNEFIKLLSRGTKLPQVDVIRDTLKVIDINGLNQINQHIVKKAVENKVFVNGTIDFQ